MTALLDYFNSLFGAFPQLSWLKYVFMGLFVLITFDAVLNLIFSSIQSMFRGK